MTDKSTVERVKFTRIDRFLLYVFPPLLYTIVLEIGHGWLFYVLGAAAFFSGFAVVRGIEAALRLPSSTTPLLDSMPRSEIRDRAKATEDASSTAGHPNKSPGPPV